MSETTKHPPVDDGAETDGVPTDGDHKESKGMPNSDREESETAPARGAQK